MSCRENHLKDFIENWDSFWIVVIWDLMFLSLLREGRSAQPQLRAFEKTGVRSQGYSASGPLPVTSAQVWRDLREALSTGQTNPRKESITTAWQVAN